VGAVVGAVGDRVGTLLRPRSLAATSSMARCSGARAIDSELAFRRSLKPESRAPGVVHARASSVCPLVSTGDAMVAALSNLVGGRLPKDEERRSAVIFCISSAMALRIGSSGAGRLAVDARHWRKHDRHCRVRDFAAAPSAQC
jgi:hypothetical protein